MRRVVILSAALLLFASSSTGCSQKSNSNEQTNPIPSEQPKTAAEESASGESQIPVQADAVNSAGNAPAAADVPTTAKVPAKRFRAPSLDDSWCALALSEQEKSGWNCLFTGQYQCYAADGCSYQGKKYHYGNRIPKEAVRTEAAFKGTEAQNELYQRPAYQRAAYFESEQTVPGNWRCSAERCPFTFADKPGLTLSIPRNARVFEGQIYCGDILYPYEEIYIPDTTEEYQKFVASIHAQVRSYLDDIKDTSHFYKMSFHDAHYDYLYPFIQDYACEVRDNKLQWLCANPDGCGRNGMAYVEMNQPEFLDGKLVDNVCKKGDCACGKHRCGKNQTCIQGNCWFNGILENDQFAEFNYFTVRDNYNCNDISLKNGIWCDRKKGCWTSGGIHYPYGAHVGINDDAAHDDTGKLSSSFCSLRRDDGLKPLREAGESADSFICDNASCACGEQRCREGQVCNRGNCEHITCQAAKFSNLATVWLPGKPVNIDGENYDEVNSFDREEALEWFEGQGDEVVEGRFYDTQECDVVKDNHRFVFDQVKYPDPLKSIEISKADGRRSPMAARVLSDSLCAQSDGCECNGERCPMTGVCSEQGCIDPVTNQPFVKKDGYLTAGIYQFCASPQGCQCGSKTCAQGKTCMNGVCSRFDAEIRQKKRYLYDQKLDINGNRMSIDAFYCTEQSIEDGYACVVDGRVESNHCDLGDGPFSHVDERFDSRCMRREGCACGDSTCPQYAQCIDNACYYDDNYKAIACYWTSKDLVMDENKQDSYDMIEVSPDGLCLCNGTVLEPADNDMRFIAYMNSEDAAWSCTNAGWQCVNNECECGSVSCKKGEICVRPDICAQPNPTKPSEEMQME